MPRYIEKAEEMLLPVIPLTDAVAFPAIPIEFDCSEKDAANSARYAQNSGKLVLLVAVNDAAESEDSGENTVNLYSVGTVACIRQYVESGSEIHIACECRCRATVREYYRTDELLTASLIAKQIAVSDESLRAEAYRHELTAAFKRIADYYPKYPIAIDEAVKKLRTPELIADFIAASTLMRGEDKQAVLETFEPFARCEKLLELIDEECTLLEYEKEIQHTTQGNVSRAQREFFLREQIKVIEDELGEGDDPDDYSQKIREAHLPAEVEEKLLKENDRLSKTPFGSAEATVLRNYLDVVLEIPWNKRTRDRINVAAAQKILDADHDGLEKVKDRILEFLSVKQLNPGLKNQIICLVGPPGTGKTSIAASIAHAMNRKYVRVSLGGVHDESDIRGHRKTYVASMPGRIIAALTQVGVSNPLMLLDEIDKVCADAHGDPASALLEVLDPEQNKSFRDHFVELPFDLSDVLFITTANSLSTVPRPLIDRMEVIELPGYTRREKLSIAKNHLIPKQLKRHGMTRRSVKLTDEAIYEVIDCYTYEAGVRNLERSIADLCRKSARKIVESGGELHRVVIGKDDIRSFLGGRKVNPDRIREEDLVGVVNGMAYTEAGGDLLKIEAAVLEGTGKLELTGSLGDVMKESAHAALTYVRSIAAEYHIPADFYKTRDIHIHVPEGAVPKDGPSAGVTMVTVLVSALAGIPVAHDIAMTGEVTLTGRVLAIGGLREKTMAAYAAGIRRVLIPEDNMSNLDEVDAEVREKLEFIPCRSARDVLAHALVPAKTGVPLVQSGISPAVSAAEQPVSLVRSAVIPPSSEIRPN